MYMITDDQVESIRQMQETIYQSCVDAGWYTDMETGQHKPREFGVAIALMHSELSEALEGHRKDLTDSHIPSRKNVEVELADCIIRILDTAQYEGLDIGAAIRDKFAYNQIRADHKMENRKLPGGKSI